MEQQPQHHQCRGCGLFFLSVRVFVVEMFQGIRYAHDNLQRHGILFVRFVLKEGKEGQFVIQVFYVTVGQ